jgi:hypothetical protein
VGEIGTEMKRKGKKTEQHNNNLSALRFHPPAAFVGSNSQKKSNAWNGLEWFGWLVGLGIFFFLG